LFAHTISWVAIAALETTTFLTELGMFSADSFEQDSGDNGQDGTTATLVSAEDYGGGGACGEDGCYYDGQLYAEGEVYCQAAWSYVCTRKEEGGYHWIDQHGHICPPGGFGPPLDQSPDEPANSEDGGGSSACGCMHDDRLYEEGAIICVDGSSQRCEQKEDGSYEWVSSMSSGSICPSDTYPSHPDQENQIAQMSEY
jgi:hypothetical protein